MRLNFTSRVAATIIASMLMGQAQAQTEIKTIDELTAKSLMHLTINTRYSYTEKFYGDIEFGKCAGQAQATASFSDTTGTLLTSHSWYQPKSEKKYGNYVNGDQRGLPHGKRARS